MKLSRVDKVEFSGIAVLLIGVALLAFTFLNAYWFLREPLSILGAAEFTQVFGEALAPLIVTCVRIMYMGVMGWIGSLLTLRGIALMSRPKMMVAPQVAKAEPKPVEVKLQKPIKEVKPQETKQEARPEAKPQEAKPEAKPEMKEPEKPQEPSAGETQPPQPEVVVIPPTPEPVQSSTPKDNSPQQ